MAGLGVPVKLLHESLGHIITVEVKTGQLYRGKLAEAEDNMNIFMRDATVTGRDGRVSQLDQVYIRGSMIRFFIVPDMLKNAPMFRRSGPNGLKGKGIGTARGRATIMRANGTFDLKIYCVSQLFLMQNFFIQLVVVAASHQQLPGESEDEIKRIFLVAKKRQDKYNMQC
ncbi:Sm-like ribonucleo protein [Lentinula edodes]|uniref:Small nuclear ribonucleoprotein Sm D3 n=1 Tax=Lentinula edodes TaxID=5353 RepID=A0A1Q3EDA2_LENED|nr:Sm-like ribonucleo protein [Lentinula edodes]